jgi:DnaJ-class molecular chaperone
MPNENNKPIVKRLQVCKVCEGHGYVRTVDSTHYGNKLDPIYNTSETCPVCKGEKYYFG